MSKTNKAPTAVQVADAAERAMQMDPLATIVNIMQDPESPDLIKGVVHRGLQKLLMMDLQATIMCAQQGPAVRREEMESVESTVVDSHSMIDSLPADRRPKVSATVRDATQDLARSIDKAIKRVLLEDTHANRHHFLNILQCTANISASLEKLALTEEQKEMVIKHKADQSLDDIDAQNKPLN